MGFIDGARWADDRLRSDRGFLVYDHALFGRTVLNYIKLVNGKGRSRKRRNEGGGCKESSFHCCPPEFPQRLWFGRNALTNTKVPESPLHRCEPKSCRDPRDDALLRCVAALVGMTKRGLTACLMAVDDPLILRKVRPLNAGEWHMHLFHSAKARRNPETISSRNQSLRPTSNTVLKFQCGSRVQRTKAPTQEHFRLKGR
jgi:hypothetical protein